METFIITLVVKIVLFKNNSFNFQFSWFENYVLTITTIFSHRDGKCPFPRFPTSNNSKLFKQEDANIPFGNYVCYYSVLHMQYLLSCSFFNFLYFFSKYPCPCKCVSLPSQHTKMTLAPIHYSHSQCNIAAPHHCSTLQLPIPMFDLHFLIRKN